MNPGTGSGPGGGAGTMAAEFTSPIRLLPAMSFNVTVQPANRIFTVESDEAILPAAIRQGIRLPNG